jgi:hypothetical protein
MRFPIKNPQAKALNRTPLALGMIEYLIANRCKDVAGSKNHYESGFAILARN